MVPRKRLETHVDAIDDIFEQNKTWMTLALQLGYLIFLAACIPYVFLAVSSPAQWIPIQIFLLSTLGTSLFTCVVYLKTSCTKLMYCFINLYGVVFPYVCWIARRHYMVVDAICWNWLTLSMILLLIFGSRKVASGVLVLQIVTPAFGALMDAAFGFEVSGEYIAERYFCLAVPTCVIFVLFSFFSQVLLHSRTQVLLRQELSLSILRSILPAPAADSLLEQLSRGPTINIADNFDHATVCFCDIVGFTSLCLTVPPSLLVEGLNAIFTHFDRLCMSHGVEKIKTIGDAYMFAGLPVDGQSPREAAVAVVWVAIRMVRHMSEFRFQGSQLEVRAGVNTGPLVAGVIGCTKFAYDVWGPTVNLASRLESSGLPGQIQVSASTRELIQPSIPCTFRDCLALKGAGQHDAFLVELPTLGEDVEMGPEMPDSQGLHDIASLMQEINFCRRQSTSTMTSAVVPASSSEGSLAPRRHRRGPPMAERRHGAAPVASAPAAPRKRGVEWVLRHLSEAQQSVDVQSTVDDDTIVQRPHPPPLPRLSGSNVVPGPLDMAPALGNASMEPQAGDPCGMTDVHFGNLLPSASTPRHIPSPSDSPDSALKLLRQADSLASTDKSFKAWQQQMLQGASSSRIPDTGMDRPALVPSKTRQAIEVPGGSPPHASSPAAMSPRRHSSVSNGCPRSSGPHLTAGRPGAEKAGQGSGDFGTCDMRASSSRPRLLGEASRGSSNRSMTVDPPVPPWTDPERSWVQILKPPFMRNRPPSLLPRSSLPGDASAPGATGDGFLTTPLVGVTNTSFASPVFRT